MCVFISCETGGSNLPPWVKSHAVSQGGASQSDSQHERLGQLTPVEWKGDTAARFAARRMARRLDCPLVENRYSPQLIDVSRSPHHRELFPGLTRSWDELARDRLITEIHTPYRQSNRQQIARMLLQWPHVIHLSVRTFASVNHGFRRRADVGLGYDPRQTDEVDFCLDWIDELYEVLPMVRVRRNYPRRGTIDSITKAMRNHFAGMNYLGIELQLNRAWVARPLAVRERALDAMTKSLATITQMLQSDAA